MTLHNGLDRERLLRDRHPRTSVRDEVVILLLGTVCRRKGQIDLVDALDRLDARHLEGIRCFIVGDRPGEYSGRLHDRLRRARDITRDRITVVPETPEVGPYLGGADIFVCTSRLECYPRVILEAMAYGLPIVTTPVFGIREQVKEEVNALFYEPGDVEGLADGIARLLDDPALRRRMGRESPEVLRTLTDFDENLETYSRIFREAWITAEVGEGKGRQDRRRPALQRRNWKPWMGMDLPSVGM
jgi:glycosyltransferase involved in cell wall biosynthesis